MLRLALVAAVFLAPSARAQPAAPVTLGGGVGVGDVGTGVEKFAFAATLVVPLDGVALGVHAEVAEALDIFSTPARRNLVVGALAGTAFATRRTSTALLVGPTYTERRTRGERLGGEGLGDAYRVVDRRGVGVMGRVVWTAFPFERVPVGARLEGGVNASTVGVTTSLVPGLAVRLGPR